MGETSDGLSVLWATDGGDFSAHAAGMIASPLLSNTRLLRILAVAPIDDLPALSPRPAQHREKEMAQATSAVAEAAQALASTGLPVETTVKWGSAGKEIVSEARSMRADLVIIGGARHGLIHDLLLGTTAKRVLREAHCSVLIVRPTRDDSMTSIVIPVLQQHWLPNATRVVRRLNLRHGTAIRIVGIVKPIAVVPGMLPTFRQHVKDVEVASREVRKRSLRDAIDRAEAELKQRNLAVTSDLLEDGTIESLARYIDEWNPELVVLGDSPSGVSSRTVEGGLDQIAMRLNVSVLAAR